MEKFWLMIYLLSAIWSIVLLIMMLKDINAKEKEINKYKKNYMDESQEDEQDDETFFEEVWDWFKRAIKIMIGTIALCFIPGFNTICAISMILYYDTIVDEVVFHQED